MFTVPCGLVAPTVIASIPTSGLKNWLKADVGVTTGGGFVTAWSDQSGLGNNWVSSSGGITVLAGAQNGLPAVRVTATTADYYMTATPFISGSSDGEIFLVLKTTTNNNFAWGGMGPGNGGSSHYTYSGADIYENFGVSTRQGPYSTGANNMANFQIYNVSMSATTQTARIANVALGTNAATRGWDPTTFYMFQNQATIGNGGIYNWRGQIGEMVVYNRVLSSGERLTVYNYLKARWGL